MLARGQLWQGKREAREEPGQAGCYACSWQVYNINSLTQNRAVSRIQAPVCSLVGLLWRSAASLSALFLPTKPPQVLAFLASEAAADADNVLAMCMRLGDTNFHVMKLLDEGHTSK